MAATTDETDRHMTGRIQRAFKRADNAEWREAYFDQGTHAGHTDPGERARHQRHVEAVQQMQDELRREEEARAYRAALGTPPVADRTALELQIHQAQGHPAFGDGRHKDHADQVAHVGHLYKQLSALK